MVRISTFAFAVGWLGVAFAQAPSAPPEFTYTVDKSQRMSPATGAPYSADEVHEFSLPGPDGKPVSQATTTQHVYRDSVGRMRRDHPVPGTEFWIVEIQDPVARCEYVLDPQQRIAHRLKPPLFEIYDAHKAGRKIEVPKNPAGDVPSPVAFVPLGTRMIEGVNAEGTRQIIDMPATSRKHKGRRGFKATMEVWNSTELEIPVLSINSGERIGESVTKLVNIRRSDPDPALFEVPAGYTVVDESDSFTVAIRGKTG